MQTVRKKLMERKIQLEQAFSNAHQKTQPTGQVLDSADQALSSVLEELKVSLHNNELLEYRMILNALKMLDNGTYGVCIECKQNISEKRLELIPNATRCLRCQEALEDQELI